MDKYRLVFMSLSVFSVVNLTNVTSDATNVTSLANATSIKVGVLLMTNSTFPLDLPRVGPAIDKGVEEVRRRYGLTFDVRYKTYSVWCTRARYLAPGYMAELYLQEGFQAFVGPACSYAVQTAGRMAEYLRVPMVTGLGDLASRNPLENDMFETTAILSYNIHRLSVSVQALLREFQWAHVSVIYDEDEVFYLNAGPSMVKGFEEHPDFPEAFPVPFRRSKAWQPERLLQEASKHARVFVILVNVDQFRTLMFHAQALGMAGGDYVFIAIQLAEIDWWGTYRNFLKGDALDAHLHRVFESVLILSLVNPVALNMAFQEDIKMRSLRDYDYVFQDDEPVHYFITAFYEAVLYLGAAYNKSFVETGGLDDGYAIARMFFNGTFEGLNQTVALDEFGTRIADFEVLDLKHADTAEFQRVGLFLGSSRSYMPVPGVSIRFPAGVPRDMPVCGFTGELCVEGEVSIYATIAIVCGVLVMVLLAVIAGLVFYTRRKANMDKRWRIYWRDVDVIKTRDSLASGFSKSKLSVDEETQGTTTGQVANGTLGYYKGNTVFIRRYNIASVDVTSKLEDEMRKLYNLRQNNIETFIGACVEPGNIAVLAEVCPRGSLMDIIANDGIELDWSFRLSLINDIVQGMKYLHNSDIKVHGSLKSSNCVVDSRFLLKVKGFGPKCFQEMEQKGISHCLNPFKLLWTAPELLRHSGWHPGTRPADVYSFAIILYEIIARRSPYEQCDLSTVDVLERVRAGLSPPFRPALHEIEECSSDLPTVMEKCWAEARADRPSFEQIDITLKKMLKSRGTNIMDNLMRRMEQYANNLESLVEERTNAYAEEKKRAEDLLYRMLPVSVARQLQHGSQVEPETFDNVTIYFSDIVGFTTLAGRSTPMQVVDLLNDLYTTFDAIIDNFNVYKVETIGDAYMCASGLPIRNEDLHVVEISNMALAIRKCVRVFKIRHLPSENIQVRIGIHSGSVVAGVVGLTMPRYCLFGDTVNTASRMESNGEAMKIHISETAQCLLDAHGGYQTELRGDIEIKGKGVMHTFWLVGQLNENSNEVSDGAPAAT